MEMKGKQRVEDFEENDTAQNETGDDPFVPPDGGWGWIVMISAFICLLVLEGTAHVFGIFILNLDDQLDLKNLLSLMISVRGAFIQLVGPFAALMVREVHRVFYNACDWSFATIRSSCRLKIELGTVAMSCSFVSFIKKIDVPRAPKKSFVS